VIPHRRTRRNRRLALGISGAILALFAASCLLGDSPSDSSPAMYRGNPEHTGVYRSGGAPDFGGIRWRFQTDGPIRSSPAVAGGRVYFGSADGHVYALDLQGRQIWKTDLGAGINSSPAVADGRVILQSHRGEIVALSADRGAVVWRVQTGPVIPFEWGFESGDYYDSSPVVVGQRVWIGAGDGNLYALDAATGKEIWRFKTEGRIRSSPAMAGGAVYVGSMDGSLYAVDAENGKLRWRFDTQGRALKSADFGFDRKSIQSSPAVADGAVYLGGRDGFLYAVDAATGKERWRLEHSASWINTAPAVAAGRVYAGTSDGRFIEAVEAETGKRAWRIPTRATVWGSPSVVGRAGGLVYVGDTGGTLHVIDVKSGQESWSYRLGGGILGAAVPADGMLLVGSNDGALSAIGAGEGGPIQRVAFWDQEYEKASWLSVHKALRDELEERGYQIVDGKGLEAFLVKTYDGGAAPQATLVFAMDLLPRELAPGGEGAGLLRRFLNEGGKVVWVGTPPLVWPKDPETGDPGPYAKIDRRAARNLLGVDFTAANFDRWGTRITDAGRAWGLRTWWAAPWSVKASEVSEVLASDENGLAAAWVKSYGGPPGTGFVMIGRGGEPWTDFGPILAVADYRPSK
jgi:outer membrane protein assembly factor BamB